MKRSNSTFKLIKKIVFCGTIISALSTTAYAQNRPVLTDSNNYPPELQYDPIKYKGFVLAPELKIDALYDDNIYAVSENEESDFLARVKPSLLIEKEMGASTLNLFTNANIERYNTFTEENTEDFAGSVNFQQDINSRWAYEIGAGYSHISRERRTPTSLAASESPLYIDTFETDLKLTRRFNRLSLTLIGSYEDVTNEDGVSQRDPTTEIIYSVDDRQVYGGQATLVYDLLPSGDIGSIPQKAVYLTGGVKDLNYEPSSQTVLSRDNQEISALAGFIGSFKKFSLSTDVGIGFLGQRFQDDRVKDTNNLNYYAKIQYVPTLKHRLFFDAGRQIRNDNALVTGIVQTDLSLVSSYELQHNLFLRSQIFNNIYDYNNGEEDKDYTGSVGLTYLLSPRLKSSVMVSHTKRVSETPTDEFDRSQLMLRLTGRL